MEGLNLEQLEKKISEEVLARSKKNIEQGLMVHRGHFLVLTKKGKLLADGIAADLFS